MIKKERKEQKKDVDNEGFDPSTSRMLSVRSTNWASRPIWPNLYGLRWWRRRQKCVTHTTGTYFLKLYHTNSTAHFSSLVQPAVLSGWPMNNEPIVLAPANWTLCCQYYTQCHHFHRTIYCTIQETRSKSIGQTMELIFHANSF